MERALVVQKKTDRVVSVSYRGFSTSSDLGIEKFQNDFTRISVDVLVNAIITYVRVSSAYPVSLVATGSIGPTPVVVPVTARLALGSDFYVKNKLYTESVAGLYTTSFLNRFIEAFSVFMSQSVISTDLPYTGISTVTYPTAPALAVTSFAREKTINSLYTWDDLFCESMQNMLAFGMVVPFPVANALTGFSGVVSTGTIAL
jgi:hypothetical protein